MVTDKSYLIRALVKTGLQPFAGQIAADIYFEGLDTRPLETDLFAQMDGLRKDNPAHSLRGPKQGRGLPKILSHDDIDALFNAPLGARGRFARRANIIRPCRYCHDADLYPCARRTNAAARRGSPSPGEPDKEDSLGRRKWDLNAGCTPCSRRI